MKMKYSWIPFIPVAILSVVLRVYQLLFVDNKVDTGFLSSNRIWNVYACLVGVLFAVLAVLCIADRKTSEYYEPKANIFAGIFAVLSAGVIIFNAGMQLGALFAPNSSQNSPITSFINMFFGILSGIVILLMGISSFSGNNFVKKTGIFSVIAPVWCCIQLVEKFIEYTRQSVNSLDMTNLFYMAFITLAIFNISMLYQKVSLKNPVKSTILYGMPGFVTVIVYAVANAIKQYSMYRTYDIINSLDILSFLLLGFYILFIMAEVTMNAKSKEYDESYYVGKGSLEIEEEKNTEENQTSTEQYSKISEELTDEELHVNMTDVEEDLNENLDEVDNVLERMKKEESNPEKYSPYSEEYFNRGNAEIWNEDQDIEKSLENIDRLIGEISAEQQEN